MNKFDDNPLLALLEVFKKDSGVISDLAGSAMWIPESAAYQRTGVYKQLAGLMDRPLQGKSILDICSGTCPMENELSHELRNSKVVAIEANDLTIDHAVNDLHKKGLSSQIVRTDADLKNSAVVSIIAGAIHENETKISALLGPEGADISLVTLLGTSPKLAEREQRHVNDAYMAQEGLRQLANTITDAFKTATKYTRSGGQLLRAERTSYEGNVPIDKLIDFSRKVLKPLTTGFWEIESSHFLSSHIQEIEEITNLKSPIIAHSLRRTDVPYDEEIFEFMRRYLPVIS